MSLPPKLLFYQKLFALEKGYILFFIKNWLCTACTYFNFVSVNCLNHLIVMNNFVLTINFEIIIMTCVLNI